MHINLSRTQRSSVHFPSFETSADGPALPLLSPSSPNEIPLSCYLSNFQINGITKSITMDQSEYSLVKSPSSTASKRKTLLTSSTEPSAIGEGEDYFLSLFGQAEKVIAHPFSTRRSWKYFSMVLEEVGQSRSSAFGDIKIAEVNGLFVKLINSSLNKELEIGNHILQQNINGKPISVYHFPPSITMQANSTVTVWTAGSEGKNQPPSDFLWAENHKFRTSPDCTTILCKPTGEAIAWCTPIHWKQAWEKLETDIEFSRSSVVSASSQRHMFHWQRTTTTTEEEPNQSKNDTSDYQMEPVSGFLTREKAIPPILFLSRSPWCHSPSVPTHPHCPLIEPHDANVESSLNSQPKPPSARIDSALAPPEGSLRSLLRGI